MSLGDSVGRRKRKVMKRRLKQCLWALVDFLLAARPADRCHRLLGRCGEELVRKEGGLVVTVPSRVSPADPLMQQRRSPRVDALPHLSRLGANSKGHG